jgi:hypothetical protein
MMLSTRPRMFTRLAAGVLLLSLMLPTPAHAQFGNIFSVIIGLLGQIKGFQTSMQQLVKVQTWPLQLINQARGFVTGVINQYQTQMQAIVNVRIQSAQLPSPQQLESLMRSGNTSNIANISAGYGSTYGTMPTVAQAPAEVRQSIDLGDALARDSLAQTVASDQTSSQLLRTADALETSAAQAAPGSAPYVTASALATTLESMAFQHKLLAAQLREEAANLANHSAAMKARTQSTNTLYKTVQDMLSAH